jgi:hypothetical protein
MLAALALYMVHVRHRRHAGPWRFSIIAAPVPLRYDRELGKLLNTFEIGRWENSDP